MKTAIKTIELSDYDEVQGSLAQLKWFDNEFRVQCPTARIDTPNTNTDCNTHKWWEWARILHLIKGSFEVNSRILDIGAACGLMGPSLAYLGYKVTEVEIDAGWMIDRVKIMQFLQSIDKDNLRWVQSGFGGVAHAVEFATKEKPIFDVVLSVSTIEHVPPNIERTAWKEMVDLTRKGGMLIVTADVMPEARKGFKNDHVRWTNYSMDMLKERVEYMKGLGMETIGEEDYRYHGSFVFDYSFAFIAMRKK